MTTHQCPTCRHEHDTPHQTEMGRAVDALAPLMSAAVEVGAPILSAGLTPNYISFSVGTETGLRELAADIGFPEPTRENMIGSLETQGDYAGVSVALRHYYQGGGQ